MKIEQNKSKMENTGNLKIFLAIATLSTLSVVLIAEYRRRRRQRCSRTSCYLHSESKPQYAFKRVLADNSYSAFKHLKLNDSGNDNTSTSHPYEAEITALLENPRLEFKLIDENVDLSMRESYIWVETESQIKLLVEVLSKERIFGVDTEQHSLRSFLGFTALIQLSTQKEDYLIDTIALHDFMGLLRPIFANPSICKVFHGADNDVMWLQRDFHIYVVNLFDTAKASEVLSKPQKSLAYLLDFYCNVTTNKLLQREDWRQRPLSKEMVQYARTDAHYLLCIAKCLITELEQLGNESSSLDFKFHFVMEASRRSNMTCMQLYSKEIEASPGESAASSIMYRHLSNLGGISSLSCEFQDAVKRLCAWRDLMARVHDESFRYVLSDQAIIALADISKCNQADISSTIALADRNGDSSFSSILPSPSSVVLSHLNDFQALLQDEKYVFPMILQKCLGSSGTCPMSIFNYALLINSNTRTALVSKQNGFKRTRQVARMSSRELFVQKFSCKAPVYHNCRIYADDGRLLCYCDRRKLEWYLRRDLAKLVDDDPPAIMLLFEPKGRPEDEGNDFYIQSKKNICVGCGEGNHYLRYRIIPACYRMHFPEHLKSHRSHDIVLLCVDCHEIAHAAAEKHKRQIAKEFEIPLFVRKVFDSDQAQIICGSPVSATNIEETGVSPLQLRTAAMALLRHGPKMPSKRREELREIVMKYFGGREITEGDLEMAVLVGMTPHERRRLEKKKRFTFKQFKGRDPPHPEHEKVTSGLETSEVGLSEDYTVNGPCTTKVCRREERDHDMDADDGVNASLSSESQVDGEASAFVAMNLVSDRSEVLGSVKNDCIVEADDTCYNRRPPNEIVESCFNRDDGIGHRRQKVKVSLLGHGPHGKQVVDYLLKAQGENGIHQFCQRWRQVFVEVVHPRFLPAGWDIKHSGRRDFGDFSVYNPAKKACDTTEMEKEFLH